MLDLSSDFVSVVIPTYNDLERLKKCVKALSEQSLTKDQYEIIVVDNNSTDDTYLWLKQQDSLTFTQEARPTSYAARNAGIKLAKGDILAFTDSDCIPAKDWLEQGVLHLLDTPNCGFVGGNIELFFRNPDSLSPVEIYERITALPQREYVDNQKFAATANMFTFKSVIDKVGLFDANLKSRGDYDWGRRVYQAGYSITFAESANVLHPARYSFSQMKKKSARVLSGIYDSKKAKGELNFYTALQDLGGALKPPVKKIVQLTSKPSTSSFADKLTVSFVILFLHYNKAIIIFRLCTGQSLDR